MPIVSACYATARLFLFRRNSYDSYILRGCDRSAVRMHIVAWSIEPRYVTCPACKQSKLFQDALITLALKHDEDHMAFFSEGLSTNPYCIEVLDG